MVNFLEFFEPLVIFLISIAVFLGIFVLALLIIQNKVKRKVKIKIERAESEIILKKKTEEIKKAEKSAEQMLKEIEIISRKFFSETFKLRKGLDYTEMEEFFRKRNKQKIAQFCNQMIQVIYSGEQITQQRLDVLIKNLETVIDEEIKPLAKVIEPKIRLPERPKEELIEKIKPKIKESKEEIEKKTALVAKFFRPKLPQVPKESKIEERIVKQIKEEPELKAAKEIVEIYTVKESNPEKTEPKAHANIASIDNLERIKEKLALRKGLNLSSGIV